MVLLSYYPTPGVLRRSDHKEPKVESTIRVPRNVLEYVAERSVKGSPVKESS